MNKTLNELRDEFMEARYRLYEEKEIAMERYAKYRDALVVYMKANGIERITMPDNSFLLLVGSYVQWRKSDVVGIAGEDFDKYKGAYSDNLDRIIAKRQAEEKEAAE